MIQLYFYVLFFGAVASLCAPTEPAIWQAMIFGAVCYIAQKDW